jgi:hypothetical protein
MTRKTTPNIRRIAFRKECFEELEEYLRYSEMHASHKEFLLDLSALADFLEGENYVGAEYLGKTLLEKLKSLLPDWEKLANSYVPEDYNPPIVLHGGEILEN